MKITELIIIAVTCMVSAELNAQVYKTVQVDTAGTLSALLSVEELDSVTDLTLNGTINTDDFNTMKNLMPALTTIDLKSVHTEGDSIPAYAFSGNIDSLILPSTITSLKDHALHGCNLLKSVVIPPSVTSIGSYTFWYCSGLTSLIIPDNVVSIGSHTFYGCSGLTSLVIPEKVTTLGEYTFTMCTGLTSVSLPETITSIGNLAFAGCSGLTSIDLPDSLIFMGSQIVVATSIHILKIPPKLPSIVENGFAGCSSLDSILIGPSVTSIGKNAFAGCANIKSLTIPSSVDSIAPYAFVSMSSLNSLNFLSSKKLFIGEYAFAGCGNITSVIFQPSGGTTIGRYAFVSSWLLKTLKMASPSVTSIGEYAFVNTNIDTLVFPSSLAKLGKQAFISSDSLKSVTFLPSKGVTISEYTFGSCYNLVSLIMQSPSVDSIAANAFQGCTKLTKLTIPSSLTYIGNNAFQNSQIKGSLTMPSSLNYIGAYAFANCHGIDSLTFLPASGTYIGNDAFYNCNGLKSVKMFSPSVDSIGWQAFDDNDSLNQVILPSSLTWLGPGAFGRTYGLKKIRINRLIPPVLSETSSIFYYVSTAAIDLYVPAGTREAYQAAQVWRQFHIVDFDLNLSVTPDTLNIADTACNRSFNIISSTNWQISSDQPWLTFDPLPGIDTASITFHAETNPDTLAREAVLTIAGENVESKTLVIVQDPKPYLSVSKNTLEIGAFEGNAESFTIHSNQDWTAQSDQTWLKVNPSSGKGYAEIMLSADANPDTLLREAVVTVNTGRLDAQTIVVRQLPKPFISVSTHILFIGAQAGDSTVFTINSNTNWTVASDQAWLTAHTASGNGCDTIVLSTEANPDTTIRTASITVSADGVTSQVITVRQQPKLNVSVSTDNMTIGAEEGSMASFEIVSNTGWNVQTNQIWLSANVNSGSGSMVIELTANENPDTAAREAIVTVSAEGLTSQSVVVVQDGAKPSGFVERSEEFISLYPNPVKDDLYIKGAAGGELFIYNLEGSLMVSKRICSDAEVISLSSLQTGLYTVIIGNNQSKLIKE
jgi:hypothetical protein